MQLYPNWKQQDEYIHAPLIGRDKTSNEGMMLTNVALLEILGLLKKNLMAYSVLGQMRQKESFSCTMMCSL